MIAKRIAKKLAQLRQRNSTDIDNEIAAGVPEEEIARRNNEAATSRIPKGLGQTYPIMDPESNEFKRENSKNTIKNAVFSARVGWGISATNKQLSRGVNIEKWPEHNEWYLKCTSWPDGESTTLEEEEELDGWLNENLQGDEAQIERYRIMNEEGFPIKTRSYDPDLDDQMVGEYEQHGPDPISMTDLQ